MLRIPTRVLRLVCRSLGVVSCPPTLLQPRCPPALLQLSVRSALSACGPEVDLPLQAMSDPRPPFSRPPTEGPRPPFSRAPTEGPRPPFSRAPTEGPRPPFSRAPPEGPRPPFSRAPPEGPRPPFYRAPPGVRGMTTLDRQAFSQTVTVPAVRVPKGVINKVMKSLKRCGLPRPGISRLVREESSDADDVRLLLLDPNTVSSAASFTEAELEALRSFDVPQELVFHALPLTYHNLKSEEVLRAVLPEGQDVSTSFSRVGHIAHMNLRDHQLPYRSLIGQVIMDKNPGVTCVVNKTNIIDSTYRNFKMEVLAGEDNMMAKVKENGVTYEFDFSRVYWNPRLGTEHERVVNLLNPGDVVLDVFAGVGPFALPAARRGATVLANDLNPESYRWLQHNAKINRVDGKIRTFNMDGRAFIQGPVKEELPSLLKGPSSRVHILMNLPALAVDFLDAFPGLLRDQQQELCPLGDHLLPVVHCYGFSKDPQPQKDLMERASARLGVSLKGRCSVHLVRNVAPNKEMMCISFSLPREVLLSCHSTEITEPEPKRQKVEETIH